MKILQISPDEMSVAYMLATHESSIGFGDAGHTVTRTDTLAPASDEKVKQAQRSAEFRGWQNLEYLLDYLDTNQALYTEWATSRYRQTPQPKYFMNAFTFQNFGHINIDESRLTYNKLIQLIVNIEDTEVSDLIPADLLPNPFGSDLSESKKFLVKKIQAYIAHRVAALHTSQTTHDQRAQQHQPEYKPVIRPLFENIEFSGNYYQDQADKYRSQILDILLTNFDIDKTGDKITSAEIRNKIPQTYKVLILWFYIGCEQHIIKKFPRIFGGDGTAARYTPAENQMRIIDTLAGNDVTKRKQVEDANLYDCLFTMEMSLENAEKLEKEYQKMKH